MDVGFETIGNATLILYDGIPVLATDPWIRGSAYFGSWDMSHEIPAAQMDAIRRCKLVWVSHGHPDHLSAESLEWLRDKTVLLPDAVGGRLARDLQKLGYQVRILQDRVWNPISKRIKILCIADCNQDAILLADINGRLVVNLNDASDRGWGRFVKRVIGNYDTSFLLRLSGFGDADMINLYHEDGTFITPPSANREPPGKEIAWLTNRYGARYFIPFSSMHRYQRKDSIWASQYTTHISDYPKGFESDSSEILPAFVRYDCAKDLAEPIHPVEKEAVVHDPAEFNDRWEEPLEADEVAKAAAYFKSIAHLEKVFDVITLRVGGRDHHITLAKKKLNRGITFEAPRHSLMVAIGEEIFDDLLIGNFMKTTLHGNLKGGLYPDFAPYVAKYADNGRAKTAEELHRYFREYRKRAPLDFLRYHIEQQAKDTLRSLIPRDSALYRIARTGYRLVKAA